MAKYAINEVGVEALKNLSKNLCLVEKSISDANLSLENKIRSVEEHLGIYADSIIELVTESRKSLRKTQDSITMLATKIAEKAENIIALFGFESAETANFGDFTPVNNNAEVVNKSSAVMGLKPDRISPRDLSISRFGFNKAEDGNMVYDSPTEMNAFLYKEQGSAKWNYQGTCGLCSCANVLRLAGVNATEREMIDYAAHTNAPNSIEKLCATGHLNAGRNGGTNPEGRQAILEHFGIDSGLFSVEKDNSGYASAQTMNIISDAVASGKGVILSVHADMLWHDAPYGINDYHAVTVTSVKKDNLGNVLGYYICDSARGGTTYYEAEKVRRCLTGARMNITHQIVR